MYSVIQPVEVLNDKDEMVSTWMVLATDLATKESGDLYISEAIERDMQEFTWVVKTSDILKFAPEVLQYIVLAYEDEPTEG